MRQGTRSLVALFTCVFGILSSSAAQADEAKSKPVVRLASLVWEPYIGPRLEDHGYAAEVVHKAFDAMGYQLQIEFYPWARALMLSQTGKVDGIFPEYWGAERETDFKFSDGFGGGPVGFFKRKASDITYTVDPVKHADKSFQALKKYRFGVVRGYLNTPEFDAASYLIKDSALSDMMNLKKLYWQRVDLVFIDKNVANYLLRTKLSDMASALEFMDPPLANRELHVAFSRRTGRSETLARLFNEGLKKLKVSGELMRLQRKHKLGAQ